MTGKLEREVHLRGDEIARGSLMKTDVAIIRFLEGKSEDCALCGRALCLVS